MPSTTAMCASTAAISSSRKKFSTTCGTTKNSSWNRSTGSCRRSSCWATFMTASGPAWTLSRIGSSWKASTRRGPHPGKYGKPMASARDGACMLPLDFSQDPATPLKLLFLGAHSDDIEIGCGGTVLQLLSARANVDVAWVVFSSSAEREREARTSASLFLEQSKGQSKVIVKKFRDGYFPYQGTEIKEFFDELRK